MAVPDYFDRYNPDLLALIPPDAKVILEVGCGAGKLCEVYRRVNPGVEWIGWDTNRDAVEMARAGGRCSAAIVEDADEHPYYGPDGEPRIDAIVLGDVLEHLRDPWRVLNGLVRYLRPGGQVLACIPNTQHYSILLGLLRGEWEYQPEGLLDRTHLRFFTLGSIRAMFAAAGLDIFEVRGRECCFDPAAFAAFRRTVAVEDDRPFRVYQWVIRARKPAADPIRKLHIHAVTAEACCARQRVHEPFAALQTIPGVTCTTSRQGQDAWLFKSPDIVIHQRARAINMDLQRGLIGQGSLLIAELDDHPGYLEGMRRDDFLALRAAHAVQVSTEALAEVVRPYNPHVRVIPNQVAELPPWRERTGDGPPVIFYGAQNREESWAPIMPALNRVLADHPEVRVQVVHDRMFFDAVESKRKDFHPFLPYDIYRAVLRGCDIALLPLEHTEFNRCKSDLKFLECAAEGCAVLMSEIAGDAIPDEGWDGFFEYTDVDHFERILANMIDDISWQDAVVGDAYAYVRDHRMLRHHYRDQYAWYLDLLTRKPELDRSLRGRVPELATPA